MESAVICSEEISDNWALRTPVAPSSVVLAHEKEKNKTKSEINKEREFFEIEDISDSEFIGPSEIIPRLW